MSKFHTGPVTGLPPFAGRADVDHRKDEGPSTG